MGTPSPTTTTEKEANPAPAAPQPAGDAKVAGGEAVEATAKEAAPAPEEEQPKLIPESVFKQRLARQSERIKSLQADAHQKELAAKRGEVAIKLLQAELQRVHDQWAAGAAYDPRDQQLAEVGLRDRATKEATSVQELLQQRQAEAEAAAAAEADAEVVAEQRAQVRDVYNQRIVAALTQFPAVSRVELIAAIKADLKRGENDDNHRPATPAQLAQAIHQERAKLFAPAAPKRPTTVRGPAPVPPSTAIRADAATILARMKQLQMVD